MLVMHVLAAVVLQRVRYVYPARSIGKLWRCNACPFWRSRLRYIIGRCRHDPNDVAYSLPLPSRGYRTRVSLQRLSDEWLETPAAEKCGVKLVAHRGRKWLPFHRKHRIEVLHDPEAHRLNRGSVYFPVYEMVDYIIERGVHVPKQRSSPKANRPSARGPLWDTSAVQRRAPRRLFIRCKENRATRPSKPSTRSCPVKGNGN